MIHILHLEDDPQDSQLALDLLREAKLDAKIQRVHTLPDFRAGLEHQPLDLILSDYTVPGTSALDALSLARQLRPEVPFIFLSGTIGEELAIETLRRGATDYVFKEHTSRLVPTVRRALQEAEELARRKQGEQALAKTTARFNAIITSAMDAIISIDVHQKIVLFNPAAEKVFGLPAAQALGRHINELLPERCRERHIQEVERFARTGVSSRAMGRLGTQSGLRASGVEFPIEASISQTEVGGEKLFTVILRDITARQLAEEALRASQATLKAQAEALEKTVAERTARLRETNAELEAFSYSLSHDMRAPLRAIGNFAQFAVEDCGPELSPTAKDYLEKISSAARRLDALIQGVLAFTRISRGQLKLDTVSIEPLLHDLIGDRPELQPPAAEVSIESPLPAVRGHAASLTQCFANLLGNAVKYVAPGVTPRVRVYGQISNDTARLWVEDNGIGIDESAQAKIFDLFVRNQAASQYEGSGIGLAIVRKAVERMGGRVGVESQAGQGSRFWLELPAARSNLETAA